MSNLIRPPTSRLTPVQLSAMADTGCQSCLASVKVICCLRLRESALISVTMQMRTVNNNGIKILCAVILRFSGKSPSGQTFESRQIMYVTSDSDKLFLSRETCMALGMITKNFPTVGETLHTCSLSKPDTACDAMDTPGSRQSCPCSRECNQLTVHLSSSRNTTAEAHRNPIPGN